MAKREIFVFEEEEKIEIARKTSNLAKIPCLGLKLS